MHKSIKILAVIFFLAASSKAQQTSFDKKFGQISLVYPAGTSGSHSKDQQFNLSVNLLLGLTGKVSGFELGGLGNLNKSGVAGFQLAGIFNSTRGGCSGLQIGGLFNAVSASVNGVQLSGLFNKAKKSNGFQLSLINVNDTTGSGASLGLINIIRHGGYREWEISFSDAQNVGLSFKNGSTGLYNIYNVGANFLEEQLWSAGIGFGHLQPLSAKLNFQPEALATAYFASDFKDYRRTLTYKLKLAFVYELSEKMALSVAPNLYYGDMEKGSGGTFGHNLSPIRPISEKMTQEHASQFGAGFSVGIVFRNKRS